MADHAAGSRRSRLFCLELAAAEADRQPGASDLAVPVLAATPRIQDVPVYLDGVGAVRALNNVLVRSQVDGKLISINFVEGQDVRKAMFSARSILSSTRRNWTSRGQEGTGRSAARQPAARRHPYQQLAAANAGSKQQFDTQRAVVAQQEALVNADQAAIDNAGDARLYKIIAPLSAVPACARSIRAIIHAAIHRAAVITQLQPIAVLFSLRSSRSSASTRLGPCRARRHVFGNDGITVVDTGKLTASTTRSIRHRT